jgi:hypothetical protein
VPREMQLLQTRQRLCDAAKRLGPHARDTLQPQDPQVWAAVLRDRGGGRVGEVGAVAGVAAAELQGGELGAHRLEQC